MVPDQYFQDQNSSDRPDKVFRWLLEVSLVLSLTESYTEEWYMYQCLQTSDQDTTNACFYRVLIVIRYKLLLCYTVAEDVVEILTTIQLERNVRACVLQVSLSSVTKIIIYNIANRTYVTRAS